jgi:starch synthase (maltosyl-transferring)
MRRGTGALREDSIPGAFRARVRIESVKPSIDCGRHPIKRTEGETVEVTARIFADGHDRLRARLLHHPPGDGDPIAVLMEEAGNDVWKGSFEASGLGTHRYSVEAWVDRYGSWARDLKKRHDAGQDLRSELLEGAELVRSAAARASGETREWLLAQARILESGREVEGRVGLALSEALVDAVLRHEDPGNLVRSESLLEVLVERERARYGAWYEMFPRSAGPDPARSSTFREAESQLPSIAAMGFDVLYLPPIHPIGTTNRKGPNGSLRADPEDPGSPWAIGSAAGGHESIDPALGTLEDFQRFRERANELGLEIALDLALQCSPDHPWVREHPEWFRRRPDGSIKYAENPPKKYQDIYPLDFEGERWQELWREILDLVLLWVERGVRIFRVDNPHTKTFGFWEWLLKEVRRRHSDVVFLAEAFTRPKVMQHLAKCGFSQSYTYFTWRNTKEEIQEYVSQLVSTDVAEYLRPNFFVNTPDILHEYLQLGGRPAFQIRLVLAATLSPTYGIYGPAFELCESEAVPGTEEYQDSEKYQIRRWDRDRPGNLRSYVSRVNRIRRENAALQRGRNLRFHPIENDRMVFYVRATDGLENVILVVVNLDPHHSQGGWLSVPLEEIGIEARSTYQVHDLLGDGRYLWQGDRNYVSLDPRESPAQILRVRRRIRTERDFDYYQ